MSLPPATPIAWMNAPGCDGKIGMMACPGGGFHPGAGPARLAEDLRALAEVGARALVTLLPQDELAMARVPDLGEQARAAGLEWSRS